MVVVLTLVVLLLMTYDRQNGTASAQGPEDGTDNGAGSPLTPPPTPSTP